MIDVSVIIPCFNAAPWIREALESVLRQEPGAGIEVVVVDDGSTDGSAGIIREHFPAVQVVSIPNSGPSRARNTGTKLARGEFLQYLDADDLLCPGKIRVQLEALRASGADIAYGGWQKLTLSGDGTPQISAPIDRTITDPEIELFTDFWAPPAAYLFRRTIVEKTGGWNERLPVIQDARFVLDCALRGARFVHCPGLMASYRSHTTGSVSTGSSRAFMRDCFNNAREIEAWWLAHGGISPARKQALLKVYGFVARGSFGEDREMFNDAYATLLKFDPRYIPERPRGLRALSRLVGYRHAEYCAMKYRMVKKLVLGGGAHV
ncbi:MAG: glycosyltransferase [Candidatus Omnitrophota bacterium]